MNARSDPDRSERCVWHVVTCEYAPRVGGVSDYSAVMAEALAMSGCRVHVWAPSGEAPPPQQNVEVHRTLGRFSAADCMRTGQHLNAIPGRRQIFLQWVPHGYGFKSLNVPFAGWIAWRALRHRDAVHVMVHEPFMRFTTRPVIVAASLVQRLMLWLVCRWATRVWLSIDTWRPYVEPLVPTGVPLAWLPVPVRDSSKRANTHAGAEEPPTPELARWIEQGSSSILGHFSTYSPVVTEFLAPAVAYVLRHSAARVLFIGRDGIAFRERFLGQHPEFQERVHATGVLPAPELAAALRCCDVVLQPFPDGVSARHTSTLSSLRLGRCVVTNSGPLTEPFWSDGTPVALARDHSDVSLGSLVLQLLTDRAARETIGDAGRRLYDSAFDVRHAVERLNHPGASDRYAQAREVSRAEA